LELGEVGDLLMNCPSVDRSKYFGPRAVFRMALFWPVCKVGAES